jgi:hypothetical protein
MRKVGKGCSWKSPSSLARFSKPCQIEQKITLWRRIDRLLSTAYTGKIRGLFSQQIPFGGLGSVRTHS